MKDKSTIISEVKKNCGYSKVHSSDTEAISKVQQTGEYFLDLSPSPNDDGRWIIRRTSGYLTARYLKWSAISSAIAATISTIFIILQYVESINQTQLSEHKQLLKIIERQNLLINKQEEHLQKITQTLESLTIYSSNNIKPTVLPTDTTKH